MDQPDDSFNIVDLPLEVLEMVAGYLSVKDLLACCTCSRSMREIFSENSIWRSRCDKQLCDHLRVTPCKVEPHFVPLMFENSTLSPIPQCKEGFMYQNHLWNNWRQGKKVEEVIKSKMVEMVEISLFDFFLNSVCVISVFPGRIEFIDVSRTPMIKAANDINLPISVRGKRLQVKTSDSYVILVYTSFVLVYRVDLSTKQSLFKHVFFIDQSQKCADVLREEDVNCLVNDVKHINNNNLFNISLIGNIFIGIRNQESKMHIWNVESGLKLKKQDCPIPNGYVVDFKSSSRKNVILCVEEREKISRTFLAYDLTILNFLPFKKSFEGLSNFFVLDKYVAIWVNEVLNVYNYFTSEQVLTNHPIDASSDCQGLRNNFVFTQDKTLKIFFTSSLSVSTFVVIMKPGTEQELDLCNRATWFVVLNDKFIQVRRVPCISRQRFLPVYEVDNEYKLKELSLNLFFMSCRFFLNDTSSRYIVRNGYGFVIHFW